MASSTRNNHLMYWAKYQGYQQLFWPSLDNAAPMSAFIFRIQQALKQHEANFGNTPRQRKKRTKFNNMFKVKTNYGLEELHRCLLQTSHSC